MKKSSSLIKQSRLNLSGIQTGTKGTFKVCKTERSIFSDPKPEETLEFLREKTIES
jgi:hypothetical protein